MNPSPRLNPRIVNSLTRRVTRLRPMLAVAAAEGRKARLLVGFVDGEVNRLVGADGRKEAALALLAVGRGDAAASCPSLPELEPASPPPSRRQVEYVEAYAAHEASALASVEEVRRFRAAADAGRGVEMEPLLALPELERVLARRGSVRTFAPAPLARDDLEGIVSFAASAIPADVPSLAETFLIVHAVEGLPAGVYRRRAGGGLELLREGADRRQAGFLCLEQPLGEEAAALLFFLADLEQAVACLGERGYRAAQLEGGIRAGRVYLAAFARGLGATATTFYDAEVARYLAPGKALQPLLGVAVGRRRERRRPLGSGA